MRGLAGKRVVVTGGTSGIGAATAARFREEGCDVVVLARTPGPGVTVCDVADRDQVEAVFSALGDLDVLVANAGVSERSRAVDITPGQWARVVGTDLDGAFWTAQAAARRMLAGGGGSMLFTASTNALVGYRYYADYNASQGRRRGADPLAGARVGARGARERRVPRLRAHAHAGGGVLPGDAGRRQRTHPAGATRDDRRRSRGCSRIWPRTRPPTSRGR